MSEWHWSPAEDDVLRKLAPTTRYADIGIQLGRSKGAVCARALYLGISAGRLSGPPRWTEDEVNTLRELASTHCHDEIARMLGRSVNGVKQKAFEQGIKGRPKNADQGADHWNWKGGNATNYGKVWVNTVRPVVLRRDNWMCQYPGCAVYSPTGAGLVAHHIVPRRLTMDDSVGNHVTLCKPHHGIQEAHKWVDFTPDLWDTLPEWQRLG